MEPLVWFAVIAAVVLVVFFRALGRAETRRSSHRPWRAPEKHRQDEQRPPERRPWFPERPDAADQLRAVMSATFAPRKVMELAEYKVFKVVEDELRMNRGGYRVFAQTSLGEVLSASDRQAFAAINSKRVDVLVIGPTGLPVVTIEHQGANHYQSNAAARDAVKK